VDTEAEARRSAGTTGLVQQSSCMYSTNLTTTPAVTDPGQNRNTTNTAELISSEVYEAMAASLPVLLFTTSGTSATR
jgi:hypothetical protein